MAVAARTPSREGVSPPAPRPTTTLVSLFFDRVAAAPDADALRVNRDGTWTGISWWEYGAAVTEAAAGLAALGIEPHDRVAVLAGNEPRWHEADMATMAAAAVSVPVYATLTSSQVAYILGHSASKVCFVGSEKHLAKVLLRRHGLPALTHVITFDDRPDGLDDDYLLSFDDLRALGRDRLARDPDAVNRTVAAVDPQAVATIVYTSGTTGPPKGAMLTHRNLTETIRSITAVVPIGPDDRFLSFLPLSHIAERTVSHFGQIVSGGETWFARSLATVADDLLDCRPTIFFAVPRVWEKFREAIEDKLRSAPRPVQAVARQYVALGKGRVAAEADGSRWSIRDRLSYVVLDRTLGARIRAGIGLDRARLLVSGAAPVHPEVLRWFHGLGLPVAEVYGQTEDCGPTTLNRPGRIRIGSVGEPLPDVEVRIASDGEILVRGPNVGVGYHDAPELTNELIDDDGWMHSGDIGRMEDGYLWIIGRKKDLIITSSGKNIAPQEIETRLRVEPLISQAVVVGDDRPYLTALLVLDAESVGAWAADHGRVADFESLTADPDLLAEVEASVRRANAERSPIEQIKTWRVLPRELTIAAGELTPTLKVKRHVVCDAYRGLIEELYAARGPSALG